MKRVTLSRIVLSCALFFGIMCQAQTITDPKPGNDSAARSEPFSDWLADSNLLSKASPDEERAHVERIRRLQTLQSQSAEIHESAGAEVEADIGTETVVPAAPAVQGNSLRAEAEPAEIASSVEAVEIHESAGAAREGSDSMERLIEAVEQLEMQVRELNNSLSARQRTAPDQEETDSLRDPITEPESLETYTPKPRFNFRSRQP